MLTVWGEQFFPLHIVTKRSIFQYPQHLKNTNCHNLHGKKMNDYKYWLFKYSHISRNQTYSKDHLTILSTKSMFGGITEIIYCNKNYLKKFRSLRRKPCTCFLNCNFKG